MDPEVLSSLRSLTYADISSMVFQTCNEAELFYSSYSRANGFAIRKRDATRRNGVLSMRRWVCCKEGTRSPNCVDQSNRKYKPRPLTRCGCLARFRVTLNRSLTQWRVTEFVADHSHELLSPDKTHFLRGHRKLTDADKVQISALRSVGIRPCQIMRLMTLQSGGPERVGFIDKDLHNSILRTHKSETEIGDAMKTLGYLSGKRDRDPGFTFEYTTLEDGVCGDLFWCDSTSRLDYATFGDVLMFDSTHSTNIYGRYFVLLIGINNHFQTCIFGSALLVAETIEAYEWLLRTFLHAMGGKLPKGVMTDSDNAMREAITRAFPNIPHRLCSWHLQRNAKTNIGDNKFLGRFSKCMQLQDKHEFEKNWADMVTCFDLADDKWIKKMYANKTMWSAAYLVGEFFAGQHANSRAESMNFVTKTYVNRNNNMYDLVRHTDAALRHVRNRETKADANMLHTKSAEEQVLKTLDESAAGMYTPEALKMFRIELIGEAAFVQSGSVPCGMVTVYVISRYGVPADAYTVRFDSSDETVQCSCMMFESTGFICRHIICVLKNRHITYVPQTCILQRWTKNAKLDMVNLQSDGCADDVVGIVRQGVLSTMCDTMCRYGGQSSQNFTLVRNEVNRLTNLLNDSESTKDVQPPLPAANVILDPLRAKPRRKEKGSTAKATRNKRKCSLCKSEEHDARGCGQAKKQKNIRASESNNSSQEVATSVDTGGIRTSQVFDDTYAGHEDSMTTFL